MLNFTGPLNKTERQENEPSGSTPLIWITLVGIVCGIFTIIVGRYLCTKYVGCIQNRNEMNESSKAKRVEKLLCRNIFCPEVTNENTDHNEEIIELRLDGEIGRGENRFTEEAFLDEMEYVDPLAYKREQISQNRESQHLYAPLDKIN